VEDNGGPVFPFVEGVAGHKSNKQGMSLRDWFAGQALTGEMATWPDACPEDYAGMIARRCYAIADAMLAEREKGE
jgi:hypothetical protein